MTKNDDDNDDDEHMKSISHSHRQRQNYVPREKEIQNVFTDLMCLIYFKWARNLKKK